MKQHLETKPVHTLVHELITQSQRDQKEDRTSSLSRQPQAHKPSAETKHIQEIHRLFLNMGPTRSTPLSENSSYLTHGLRKFPHLSGSA
jgi:hypothetical protein